MLCFKGLSVYKFLIERIRKGYNFFKEKFPTCHLVFFDRYHQWRFSRYTLNYLFGVFIAFIFWDFILFDLGFPDNVLHYSLTVLIVVIGLGYTFSTRFRCIVMLICLEFWGKSGRTFIRALIFGLIVSGPLRNMAKNGRETIRVFSCSALLTYNLTKTRFDLMTRPFLNAIVGMKKNMTTIKRSFKEINNVVEPIKEEIEEPDKNNDTDEATGSLPKQKRADGSEQLESAEFYQEKYAKKIENRCELQLKKGEAKCKKAFAEAYENCYRKLPALINTLFCWPMKITVVCNIKIYTSGLRGRGICDPSGVVDETLGENYYHLKGIQNRMMSNLSSVRLKYQVISAKQIPGVKSIEDTRKELSSQFLKSKSIFDFYMKIIKRILAFIFIKVIIHAVRYNQQYLNNIEADNIYVTDYFKKIDSRRKENNQRTLLPLKKIESREIIDPTSYRQSKSEAKGMFVFILKLLLELVTAIIFLLLDYIITILLDIVRENARIEYYQEGEHILNIQVNGTGIIANLIRATLRGFNTHEEIHVKLSNEQCLPKPHKLPFLFYWKFFMMYAMLIFIICNQRIIFRLRHLVCAYFYRKQEKRRVLHLYNKLLKRRKQIFVMMREVVRMEVEKHRIQRRLNIFITLRMQFPITFGWLRLISVGRRKCLICSEPEPKKYDLSRPFNFDNCNTPGCYFTYCEDCWFDVGEQCLACTLEKENSSSKQSADDY